MIAERTIRFLTDQYIVKGMTTSIHCTVIKQFTTDLNDVLLTINQVGFVKDEQIGLQERYEENCAELDGEMARLVDQCTHPSHDEHIVEGISLVVCNICGGIVEREICGI